MDSHNELTETLSVARVLQLSVDFYLGWDMKGF